MENPIPMKPDADEDVLEGANEGNMWEAWRSLQRSFADSRNFSRHRGNSILCEFVDELGYFKRLEGKH